jgi:hypothetical protein
VPSRLHELLRHVRKAHHFSQTDVGECLGMGGSYRHIEAGRRPGRGGLPGILDERPKDEDFFALIRRFITCVQATREEEGQIWELVRQESLQQFADVIRRIDGERNRNS